MSRLPIRWRITLWNTVAFAVVLLGFGILVYSLLRQAHYGQVDRSLRARFLELVHDEQLAEAPQQRLQFWMGRFAEHGETSGLILDSDGKVVARAGRFASVANLELSDRIIAEPEFDIVTVAGHGRARRLFACVLLGQRPYAVALLADLHHIEEELGLVVRALCVTVPTTLAVAAALAYLLARKALRPVEQLRRLTADITAEQLDRRLPVRNPADELGLLAQTMNSMIARLERSFAEIRRFTADASHELRTPVTIIRSEAEIGETATDLEDARSRCRSIVEECARLASATSQLLTLSREDAGVTQARREPVHVAPLLQDVVESLQPLARSKQQHLLAQIPDDAVVLANAERLRQVFHNLIDNAIKYTPAEGSICVSHECRKSETVVEVRDNGIGIAAEHLPHIFERFYRVQKTNSSHEGGTGLGLSIVESIVSRLGGRVEVESRLGEGSAFCVFLPVCQTENCLSENVS